MMDYGEWGNMTSSTGVGILGLFLWLVIIVDLVMVGIWLYQQITKKK